MIWYEDVIEFADADQDKIAAEILGEFEDKRVTIRLWFSLLQEDGDASIVLFDKAADTIEREEDLVERYLYRVQRLRDKIPTSLADLRSRWGDRYPEVQALIDRSHPSTPEEQS